jgi:hypothetical protein
MIMIWRSKRFCAQELRITLAIGLALDVQISAESGEAGRYQEHSARNQRFSAAL